MCNKHGNRRKINRVSQNVLVQTEEGGGKRYHKTIGKYQVENNK